MSTSRPLHKLFEYFVRIRRFEIQVPTHAYYDWPGARDRASLACGCGGILCPIRQKIASGRLNLNYFQRRKSDKITAALGTRR